MTRSSEPSLRAVHTQPDQWQALRDMRLAALQADPHAFGSTVARESEFPEAEWRTRASNPASFLALLDERPVGLAALMPGDGPTRELVSVWTHPDARGRGVARLLVGACVDAARAQGASRVLLMVNVDAAPARRLYEQLGFIGTGQRRGMGRDPGILLDEMALPLTGLG